MIASYNIQCSHNNLVLVMSANGVSNYDKCMKCSGTNNNYIRIPSVVEPVSNQLQLVLADLSRDLPHAIT